MTYQIVYLYNEPVNMFHIWWDCEMCKVVQETLNDGFKTFYYCISQKNGRQGRSFVLFLGNLRLGGVKEFMVLLIYLQSAAV